MLQHSKALTSLKSASIQAALLTLIVWLLVQVNKYDDPNAQIESHSQAVGQTYCQRSAQGQWPSLHPGWGLQGDGPPFTHFTYWCTWLKLVFVLVNELVFVLVFVVNHLVFFSCLDILVLVLMQVLCYVSLEALLVWGLACYAILYHALAVSAEAWHAKLYLVTPWQYLPRLGMLSYILSRLGSIHWGLACYAISCHDLAVSAEVWHAMLYLITPWQYQPRLGMLCYILSRLGSIRRGLACYSLS